MFDGIKLDFEHADIAASLLVNPLFKFTITADISTGEVVKYKASHKGLTFFVYPSNRVLIFGSLHIFYNMEFKGIRQNYDLFSLSKVTMAITALANILHMPASEIVVRNIEFGFNIELKSNVNIKKLLQNFIVYSNRQSFNEKGYEDGGYYISLTSTEAIIKFYDKGIKYMLPQKLIRIEKKIKTMRNLSKSPIYLSDLANREFWLKCQGNLMNMFKNCLFINPNVKIKMDKKEQNLIEKFIEPNFWEELTVAQRFYYSKEKLPMLNDKFNLDETKLELTRIMVSSFEDLINS